MQKTKLPLIILLVLLIVSAFIAFGLYSQKQNLSAENISLKNEKAKLATGNKYLSAQYTNLKQQYQTQNSRLEYIQKELSSVEQAKEGLQNKYQEVSKERELLVSKIKELTQSQKISVVPVNKETVKTQSAAANQGYWADVVREKAQLQAKLESMRNELIDAKTNVAKLQENNKELSIKIDEFSKTKDKLNMEMAFKERTLQIMSRDLVNERETRKSISDELTQLRNQNIELKRELIAANRDKIKLQGHLKDALSKRDELETKVSDVTNILKEKTLVFSDLQSQLTQAVNGKVSNKSSASVELPPIVVKSDASVKSLRGEVLAVNKNDNFVIIDLGAGSGVKPGLKFNVLQSGNTIGVIEIVETRSEISAANIKEVSSGHSIHEGDKVILR